MEQLEQYPKFLHVFLDAVFRKDPHEATEYHPLQVIVIFWNLAACYFASLTNVL